MSLPYEAEFPPKNWIGWNKLEEFRHDNLTPQEEEEKSKIQKYLIEFIDTSIPKRLIEYVNISSDILAVCLIMGGAMDVSWQRELTQLSDGSFIMRTWVEANQREEISETYSSPLEFDLRQELENLRQDDLKLRKVDNTDKWNENPNLDTNEGFGRYCEIYIAVDNDAEWLCIQRCYEDGSYSNNTANRILLLSESWDYCLDSLYQEYGNSDTPKIRDALAECLTKILKRRQNHRIKLV